MHLWKILESISVQLPMITGHPQPQLSFVFKVSGHESRNACTLSATCTHAVPPVFTVHPTDTNAPAQGNVTLSCSVFGFPRPQLMWLKDGIPLLDVVIVSNGTTVSSKVYLARLNVSDSASYVCRAVNTLAMVQQEDSAPGYLQVQCKCIVLREIKKMLV